MRRRAVAALLALLLGAAGCSDDDGSDHAPGRQAAVAASPYLYLGGPGTPNPVSVMSRTGVRGFTLAFVLSDGGCEPTWAGQEGLRGRAAGQVAKAQRAGAEVTVSVGGAVGRKLGVACTDARSLAGAYQQVIDAYDVAALDVDVEGAELENPRVRDRVLEALRIVERQNPGLTTMVTLPVTEQGFDPSGLRMVRRAAALDASVDIWTIMPFNFGAFAVDAGTMGTRAIESARHAHRQLTAIHPAQSDAEVFGMLGISLMNGRTDTGEIVTTRDFRRVADYAARHDLARFSFWSVNRDRPCAPGRSSGSTCSGLSQRPLEFTELVGDWGKRTRQ